MRQISVMLHSVRRLTVAMIAWQGTIEGIISGTVCWKIEVYTGVSV